MLCPQTQPAATFAFAGYSAERSVAVALNPVCVAVLAGMITGTVSGLRMALISWQDRKATHATPVRPTAHRPRK